MTALRLAESRGQSVDEMLTGMTPKEWQEWKAKDLVEPIGTDLRVCEILTKIALMIAGMLGVDADETAFMPWKQKAAKQLTPKESRAAISGYLETLKNGVDR